MLYYVIDILHYYYKPNIKEIYYVQKTRLSATNLIVAISSFLFIKGIK